MHIGIDARFYGILGKGLGRYTEQLILHLEEIDRENTYTIFLRKENFDAYTPRYKNFQKVLADIPWYSWQEQILFPILLLRHRCSVVHFTHFNVPILYRKKFVLTVHDLILFHFPTIRATTRSFMGYWIKYWAYRIILRSALLRAKRVITVSLYARRDIAENFPIKEGEITVTYQAATTLSPQDNVEALVTSDSKKRVEYGILGRYFLYVGNAYPHKNLERLLEAFASLSGDSLQLVLVGKMDYFYNRLRRFTESQEMQNVVFTGEVSDAMLADLYRGTIAYVFPSLYEGFGLPPLEAMSLNVPVLAAQRTSLPEVLGSAALYFNPEDVNDIAQKMQSVLEDEELRNQLRKSGITQVQKFSWKQLAKDTQEVYTSFSVTV